MLLRDGAYATIKDHLLQTEGSEQALSERALATRLRLGLSSVRSALERLRAEGLIAVTPNSGIRLPEVTAREIIDFYEIRLVLEPHVVTALARRLTKAQGRDLLALMDRQEVSAEHADTLTYHRLDLVFHERIAEFHGNAEMLRVLLQMRDKMYRLSRLMHRSHPERLVVNAAQHRGIVEALVRGDGEDAAKRMHEHLGWGRDFTLDPDGRTGRNASG